MGTPGSRALSPPPKLLCCLSAKETLAVLSHRDSEIVHYAASSFLSWLLQSRKTGMAAEFLLLLPAWGDVIIKDGGGREPGIAPLTPSQAS